MYPFLSRVNKNDKLMFAAFDLIQPENGAPVPEIYSEKFSQIESYWVMRNSLIL